MQGLSKQFDGAMFEIYRRAKSEAGYNATVFLQMLRGRGGLDTAKYLINSLQESDGYAALYLRNRLDLTVEAMVVALPAGGAQSNLGVMHEVGCGVAKDEHEAFAWALKAHA